MVIKSLEGRANSFGEPRFRGKDLVAQTDHMHIILHIGVCRSGQASDILNKPQGRGRRGGEGAIFLSRKGKVSLPHSLGAEIV